MTGRQAMDEAGRCLRLCPQPVDLIKAATMVKDAVGSLLGGD